MIKKAVSNGLIYTISSFLTRGISIILFPLYVNILSPEDYGLLDYLQIMATVLVILAPLEITQALARFLPEYKDRQNHVISSSLIFNIIIFIPCISLIIYFNKELSNLLFNTKKHKQMFNLIAFIALNRSLTNFFTITLQAQLKTYRSAILSFISGIGTVLFSIIFLLMLRLGIYGALLAQLLSSALTIILGIIFIRANFKFSLDIRLLKEMLKFSIPFVPSSLGVITAMYIDRALIKEFMGLYDLGLYGVAYRIASIVSIVFLGFQKSLSPLIYYNYTDKEAKKSIIKLLEYFIIFSTIIIVFLSLYSKNILTILAPDEYINAYSIIPILVAAIVLGKLYMFTPGLSIAKKSKQIAIINISCAFLNAFLNWLLIPIIGLFGACISTLIGNTIMFVLYYILGNKEYSISLNLKKILPILLLQSIFIIPGYLFTNNINNIFLSITFQTILFIISIITIIKGLLPKEDLNKIMNKIKSK